MGFQVGAPKIPFRRYLMLAALRPHLNSNATLCKVRPQVPSGPRILILVHGWGSVKNATCYSLLGLRTHNNEKCYPTMTKYSIDDGLKARFLARVTVWCRNGRPPCEWGPLCRLLWPSVLSTSFLSLVLTREWGNGYWGLVLGTI